MTSQPPATWSASAAASSTGAERPSCGVLLAVRVRSRSLSFRLSTARFFLVLPVLPVVLAVVEDLRAIVIAFIPPEYC
eukprot:3141719-Rhodomonas_salina.2